MSLSSPTSPSRWNYPESVNVTGDQSHTQAHTHTHTHTQTHVKSEVHPDGKRSCYMCTSNNRLSDLRSVSVTSVILNECELSITLCCTLGPTISKYSEESGSVHLWWEEDWYTGSELTFYQISHVCLSHVWDDEHVRATYATQKRQCFI